MTTTLAELKTRARERADQTNSTFISDSELLSYINSSYAELYDILVSRFEDYYTTSVTFSIASGNSYSLPSDFYKLRGVDYNISGDNYVTLQKFNFHDRNGRNPNTSLFVDRGLYGNKLRYRVLANELILEPSESAVGNYKLWYIPTYTRLASDSDTVDGINGWEEYIVVDVAIKMLSKEESSTTHLDTEKEALLKRIRDMAQNRDANAPERIADVYVEDSEWL